MPTYAYLRVSTVRQDLANQKLSILEFAQARRLHVDEFIEVEMSSRKTTKERGIDELIGRLTQGDILIVSELSRLARSLGQVVQMGVVGGLDPPRQVREEPRGGPPVQRRRQRACGPRRPERDGRVVRRPVRLGRPREEHAARRCPPRPGWCCRRRPHPPPTGRRWRPAD